jgi:hypothetical protein
LPHVSSILIVGRRHAQVERRPGYRLRRRTAGIAKAL